MHRVLGLLTVAMLAGAGCSSPTSPPNPSPPSLVCAAPVTVDGIAALSQAVIYPPPTIVNGTAPVAVTCTPGSGSLFPLGDTRVTCTAVDAMRRQATCGFDVTVRHRELAITTYVAFGDSMTEGENGRPINFVPVVDTANAYPTILQLLFVERIPSQRITVINEGQGGERVTDNDARLKRVLATHHPQVLLFLEGANDMLAALPAPVIANGIRDSIRTARDRGVEYVFVSTLLPVATANCLPRPALPRCRGDDVPPSLPAAANELIRPLVPAHGAYLVDPYSEFVAQSATYIDLDGLHLQPAGNRALASAFWERIVSVIPPRQLGLMPSLHR